MVADVWFHPNELVIVHLPAPVPGVVVRTEGRTVIVQVVLMGVVKVIKMDPERVSER